MCVSMAYRVSPTHTWPAHIVDVKRALAWVKENIAEYGGDADFVAISGGSAGGHLTALAALTPNEPQWQPGFTDADTSVVAAVPVYGRYDWDSSEGSGRPEFIGILQRYIVKKRFAENRQVYLDASPITRVARGRPAVFRAPRPRRLGHSRDREREFVEALRRGSTTSVVYAEIPHAQHAFDFFGSPHGHYTATRWSISWPGCRPHEVSFDCPGPVKSRSSPAPTPAADDRHGRHSAAATAATRPPRWPAPDR